MTRKEILLIHIRAEGPVSFNSCLQYCRVQHYEHDAEHNVAADLTALIKDGLIELGEDGESFDVTAETEAIAACMRARELVGRRWRDDVYWCWVDGNYRSRGLAEIDSALQRARNNFGPTWLSKVKLPKVEKEPQHEVWDTDKEVPLFRGSKVECGSWAERHNNKVLSNGGEACFVVREVAK